MRARARAVYLLRHADPVVLVAVALLVAAAAIHWGGSVPARSRNAQLQQDAQAAEAGLVRRQREALSPTARMDSFYRFFPPQATAPDWLEKIHDAAARQGLQLAQGDYRRVHDGATHLVGYQVTYPVKGSYLQLRRFIDQLLRDVPIASLDEVNLRRDTVGQAEVQATVRVTLHLKEAP